MLSPIADAILAQHMCDQHPSRQDIAYKFLVHIEDLSSYLRGCMQVKVRVGDEEKGTAAAEGQEEPGWAEVLEFAVSGEMTSNPDEEIVVRVWDHHWVSIKSVNPIKLSGNKSWLDHLMCNFVARDALGQSCQRLLTLWLEHLRTFWL